MSLIQSLHDFSTLTVLPMVVEFFNNQSEELRTVQAGECRIYQFKLFTDSTSSELVLTLEEDAVAAPSESINYVGLFTYSWVGPVDQVVVADESCFVEMSATYDPRCVINGYQNIQSGKFSTMGGGRNNTVSGQSAVIGGGEQNTVSGQFSAVLGGMTNTVSSSGSSNTEFSAIVGGTANQIHDNFCSFVGSGSNNRIEHNGAFSSIVSGRSNIIVQASDHSIIGSGSDNNLSGSYNAIAGGSYNTIASRSSFSIIGGGMQNALAGSRNVIAGGYNNALDQDTNHCSITCGDSNSIKDSGAFCFIGAGRMNTISGPSAFSAIIAGNMNSSNGVMCIIGSGYNNQIEEGSFSTTVVGGTNNIANGSSSFVGAGDSNQILAGSYSTVLVGGSHNTARDANTVVVGGSYNTASGYSSVIVGGGQNTNGSHTAFVGSGVNNTIDTNSQGSAIVSGSGNSITDTVRSFIGSGDDNTIINGYTAVLVGGSRNQIGSTGGSNVSFSAIVGGDDNSVNASFASICGGSMNNITSRDPFQVICGGSGNTIVTSSVAAVISGGMRNKIVNSEGFAAITGGQGNELSGLASRAGGMYATDRGVGGSDIYAFGGAQLINLIQSGKSTIPNNDVILSDGYANRYRLPPNAISTISGSITGTTAGVIASSVWTFTGVVKIGSTPNTIAFATLPDITQQYVTGVGANNWSVRIELDPTTGELHFITNDGGTASSSQPVYWKCIVTVHEVEAY